MKFYILHAPIAVVKFTDKEQRERYHAKWEITAHLSEDDVRHGDSTYCSECGEPTSSRPYKRPLRFSLEVEGREYGDISFAAGKLVSERFKTLFRQVHLKGIRKFDEVEIVRVTRIKGAKVKGPPPKYYLPRIEHSRVALDIEKSDIDWQEKPTCFNCRRGFYTRTRKLVIEEGTWKGEDIFKARGMGGNLFVSERFKQWFDENKINNGILIPIDEYDFELTKIPAVKWDKW